MRSQGRFQPHPGRAAFLDTFTAQKRQVVTLQLASDLITPLGAYMQCARQHDHAFILESVEGGQHLGRYSVVGMAPDLIWTCDQGIAYITQEDDNPDDLPSGQQILSPLESLKQLHANSLIDIMPDHLPPMAASGLFGNLGYDMVREIEAIPDINPDTLGLPDATMIRPSRMIVFDNTQHIITLAVPVYHHAGNSFREAGAIYDQAQAALYDMADQLAGAPATQIAQLPSKEAVEYAMDNLDVRANLDRAAYKQIVAQCKDYIYAGDIFQVLPSLRYHFTPGCTGIDMYRALRRINPSPFMFYLKFGDFELLGASPEILVRVRDEHVTIRPLAGTRPRGATPEEDAALTSELLNDPKERAEHLMLLDLGRNDVGRIAKPGSVTVSEQFGVEYYSHVMHIVSHVTGMLDTQRYTPLEALFSGFPAGTLTGAPKIRAMEIIDELEPERRNFYGGCIGYFDGTGNIDSCIALRTAAIKDGVCYGQAGGGVVADSDPDKEYEEACNKRRAILQAAASARAMGGGEQ